LTEKSAFLHIFKDKINILFIIKKTIQSQDVLVVAKKLNLNLLKELVNHVVGLDDGFTHFLEGKDAFGLFMYDLVNKPKFTLS